MLISLDKILYTGIGGGEGLEERKGEGKGRGSKL